MAKTNSTWIDVRAGLDDLQLQEHYLPYSSFIGLPNMQTQSPQMIMFIGSESKTQTMERLQFIGMRSNGKGGDIRLYVDDSTFYSSCPIFLADCELHVASSFKKISAGRVPGNIIRRPLTWRKRMPHFIEPVDLANLIYSKLISPFSTMICLFAEDLSGQHAIAKMLASWLVNLSNSPSDLPLSTRPAIMILVAPDDSQNFDEKAATRAFGELLAEEAEQRSSLLVEHFKERLTKAKLQQIVASQFGPLQVISLPGGNSTQEWELLRDRILKTSEKVYMQRLNSKVAFSAIHFKTFFHLACDHFCNDILAPFNFIKASRTYTPVPSHLSDHISAFLQRIETDQIYHFAVPTIASALVLDAFPPGMHCFNPASVFKRLYVHVFSNALIQASSAAEKAFDTLQLTNAVEHQFCEMANNIDEGRTTASVSHQEVLFKFRNTWRDIYSSSNCYACVARSPENKITCGHSLCDPCTVHHGSSSPKSPWTITMTTCPLCNIITNNVFNLKPPTAGIRVLSFDGGGVRGISSIEWLKELQSVLQLPLPIQEHFDFAIGTSSGGLITLGLFLNKWSVNECASEFQTLAGIAFRNRSPFHLRISLTGFFRRLREIIFSLTTDSRYSSKSVNMAVQAAYGENQKLFGNASKTKIAVTTTTTDNSSTVVFSNYNGPERPSGCGYRLMRQSDVSNELLVWEIARATSAAPPFFKSYKGYHDGGLGGHNNPIKLALWEQDHLWSRGSKQPDIVLSIGTGSKINDDTTECKSMSWFSQLFLPRLVRSFMTLLDGQKTWIDFLNSMPQQFRHRYHRFNLEFNGSEPEIDDIQCMRDLSQQVRAHASSRKADLYRCADNLLASLFYIELDHHPIFNRYSFNCKGRILCRLDAGTRALHALVVRLKERQARFYLPAQHQVSCVDRDTYDRVQHGEPFSKGVEFEVFSMGEEVDFKIDGITQRPRSISNCPYILDDLVRDQGLHCVFGRPDHKRRMYATDHATKRRKLTN